MVHDAAPLAAPSAALREAPVAAPAVAHDRVVAPVGSAPSARLGDLPTGVVQAGFAVALVATALLGRATMLPGETFALVWPAGGVAALWLLWSAHDRLRSGTACSLLVATLVVALAAVGVDLTRALVAAADNLVLGGTFVLVLARVYPSLWGLRGRDTVDGVAAVGRVTGAAVVAALASKAVAVPLLLVVGAPATPYDVVEWAGRNLSGLLVVFLVGHLLAHRLLVDAPRLRAGLAPPGELVLLGATTVVTYTLAFWVSDGSLAFLTALPIVHAAMRLDVLGAAVHSLVTGAVVVAATLAGHGPFGAGDPLARAVLAQMFLTVVLVAVLCLAASRRELRRANDLLVRTSRRMDDQSARLDAIVVSLDEGVVVVGPQGRLRLTNPASDRFLQALGLSGTALEGLELRDLDGRRLGHDELPSTRALRGERVPPTTLVAHGPTGVRRVVVVAALPLWEHGTPEPVEATVVVRDVTADHTRMSDLEGFAGMVAHDLKGPLVAVTGFAEAMRWSITEGVEREAPRLPHLLDRIEQNAAAMTRLIDDLLVVATSRNRSLEIEPVDLSALVADVVRTRDVEAWVEIGDLPAVAGDAVLVRHLFDNLVGNAVKYVDPGTTPRVVVEGHGDAATVTVSVTDNGIGVPPEERELVFEEFRRGLTPSGAGSGLGLSICRTVVERHGGTIGVTAGPDGTGSRFVLTLPAVVAGDGADGPVHPA